MGLRGVSRSSGSQVLGFAGRSLEGGSGAGAGPTTSLEPRCSSLEAVVLGLPQDLCACSASSGTRFSEVCTPSPRSGLLKGAPAPFHLGPSSWSPCWTHLPPLRKFCSWDQECSWGALRNTGVFRKAVVCLLWNFPQESPPSTPRKSALARESHEGEALEQGKGGTRVKGEVQTAWQAGKHSEHPGEWAPREAQRGPAAHPETHSSGRAAAGVLVTGSGVSCALVPAPRAMPNPGSRYPSEDGAAGVGPGTRGPSPGQALFSGSLTLTPGLREPGFQGGGGPSSSGRQAVGSSLHSTEGGRGRPLPQACICMTMSPLSPGAASFPG